MRTEVHTDALVSVIFVTWGLFVFQLWMNRPFRSLWARWRSLTPWCLFILYMRETVGGGRQGWGMTVPLDSLDQLNAIEDSILWGIFPSIQCLLCKKKVILFLLVRIISRKSLISIGNSLRKKNKQTNRKAVIYSAFMFSLDQWRGCKEVKFMMT